MLARRIIPCLDCDLASAEGRVVKGVEFKEIQYAGVPWELAEKYYHEGADEIVFLDITASADRRGTMTAVIEKTAKKVFIPLTVGGGIKSLGDATAVFRSGADKVTVNTSAIKNPPLIGEIAAAYGRQACVVAIDAKRNFTGLEGKTTVETKEGRCWFECSIYGGREFTGIDAIAWAREAESLGAGDIMLTSMDRDGTYDGFDVELTKAVSDAVRIPVIASGGCGEPEHILEVFEETKAQGALAASIFHYNEYTVREVKEFLEKRGIHMRV
jgi:cyclase